MLFLNPLGMTMTIKHKPLCDIARKELKAVNVGISLNIITKMATDIRYGYNIVDFNLLLLELLLGYHTYGMDRYKDDGTTDGRTYIYDIVFIVIVAIISNSHNLFTALPFEILLYLTKYYKDMKPVLGIWKSIYVSMLWCVSIIILPSVLHDNNFEILQHPLDYVPYFLLMISTSNRMDLKDIEDDKKNNVITLPVKYGRKVAKRVSNICMVIFVILLCMNIHDKFS